MKMMSFRDEPFNRTCFGFVSICMCMQVYNMVIGVTGVVGISQVSEKRRGPMESPERYQFRRMDTGREDYEECEKQKPSERSKEDQE